MKKLLTIAITSALVLASFAGCGSKEEAKNDTAENTEVSETVQESDVPSDKQEQTDEQVQPEQENDERTEQKAEEKTEEKPEEKPVSSRLSVTKINTVEGKYSQFNISNKVVVYEIDGKYGLMSHDGSVDTGAKYASLVEFGGTNCNLFMFENSTAEINPNDFSTINTCGVVDANGKEIVPAEYAVIKVLNDRYIQAIKATKRTDDKDKHMVFIYSNMIGQSWAKDGDALYEGEWFVYDVTTGKKVEGASATQTNTVNAYGKYLKFYPDGSQYYSDEICVDNTGKEVTTNFAALRSEYYLVSEGDGKYSVYDSYDDSFMFSYDEENDFEPGGIYGDYIIGQKYENGASTYVVMDKEGNVISDVFTESITLYGDYVKFGNVLYDFDGNKIADVKYVYPTNDWMDGRVLYQYEDKYTMIDKDGNVVFTCDDVADNNAYERKDDYKCYFYCFADNDYTIKTDSLSSSKATGLAATEKLSGICNLVDLFTGEVLIKNYADYTVTSMDEEEVYIYAQRLNGSYDVYELLGK